MLLAVIILFAVLLVYFLGWAALFCAILVCIAYVAYLWLADANTLRNRARNEGRPTGSLFSYLGPAMRLAKDQHRQRKESAFVPIADHAGSISLPCTYRFTYADSTGVTEQRTVDVARISSNGSLTYLEGHCHARKAERTFRTDRIRGSLTDMDSGEVVPVKRLLAEVRGRSSMAYRPEAAAKPVSTHTKEWQTAVLFTGFTAAKRDELEELAYAAGWDVRSTVGSTLDYLVTGPRAGSSKVAQAEELGVSVIDEELFRTLV